MSQLYTQILTHHRPHEDEYVAARLLYWYGGTQYPGFREGYTMTYWRGPRELVPDVETLAAQGILAIGIGGGAFDEHPSLNGEGRKLRQCCATLVAKTLGVDHLPAVRHILKWVERNDTQGSSDQWDLSHMIGRLHRLHPENPAFVEHWANLGIDAMLCEKTQFRGNPTTLQNIIGALHRNLYVENPAAVHAWTKVGFDAWEAESTHFHTVVAREFPNYRQVWDLPNGQKLVVLQTDDELAPRYATYLYGEQLGLTVIRNSRGNTQILANKKGGLRLGGAVVALRRAEMLGKGIDPNGTYLASDGQVAGAEEWTYHPAAQSLMNGSLTAPEVMPTALSLQEVCDLVYQNVEIAPDYDSKK